MHLAIVASTFSTCAMNSSSVSPNSLMPGNVVAEGEDELAACPVAGLGSLAPGACDEV